ncbi:MAG: hypothetical protein GC182_22910 [Rhodopseudomonas sp.]|nr:hypothetical protein [Rhodopseudomonas sp.]
MLVQLCVGLIAASGAALCWIVIRSPATPIYDEGWYLKSIDLLWRDGFSLAFLRDLPGPAGPTFTLVYAPIVTWLSLPMPWLRLVSTGLLAIAVALLGISFAALKTRPQGAKGPAGAVLLPGLLLIAPTAAVSGGMTLTETPALVFVTLFLALTAINREHKMSLALAAGLALGIAILGRQNYLVILPCLIVLSDGTRPSIHALALGAVVAALMSGAVFGIWGGLVPPMTAFSGRAIHPWHFVLSAGYLGIVAALIAPAIYTPVHARRWLVGSLIIAALAITAIIGEPVTPARAVVAGIYSATAGWLCAAGLSLSAVAFLAAMALRLRTYWDDRFGRFAGLVTLAGALSNANIHQFSSRYIFVFLPFMLINLARSVTVNWHLPIRLAAGSLAGLASLASYFH